MLDISDNEQSVQLLLGHARLESPGCYLGIEVDDAFTTKEFV